MCSGATPTCLNLPCQSRRDVEQDRTCAAEKGLWPIQMDILGTETLLALLHSAPSAQFLLPQPEG